VFNGAVFNGTVLIRGLTVVPLVLLAGCGVAQTQFHPGIAAQVGDQTLTTRHVDQVTDDYCQAVEKVSKGQEQSGSQRTPMRYLTNTFAGDLVDQAAAEQLADQYDVQPSSAYKSSLAQLEPQLTALSEPQKEAVREIVGARAYTSDILTQVGKISLQKQGQSTPTTDDQTAEGQKVLAAWMKDHDVEVNPKYSIDAGTQGQSDTDVSYALGDTAKNGLKAQPDADYAAALPDSLTCLD
jgi:hypothetical protein